MKQIVKLNVNGQIHELAVEHNQTLISVLRNELGLTGVKQACDGLGECGACTIIMDGKAVNSCLILAVEAGGREITTIESLSKDKLHPIQEAFIKHGAIQCGFCTPGFVMSAKALLDENPNPDEKEVREAISGNLCRCTGYVKIVDAIMSLSGKRRSKS